MGFSPCVCPLPACQQVALKNSPLNAGKKALAKAQAGEYDAAATRSKIEGYIRDNKVIVFSWCAGLNQSRGLVQWGWGRWVEWSSGVEAVFGLVQWGVGGAGQWSGRGQRGCVAKCGRR